jgi:hypothetical protein
MSEVKIAGRYSAVFKATGARHSVIIDTTMNYPAVYLPDSDVEHEVEEFSDWSERLGPTFVNGAPKFFIRQFFTDREDPRKFYVTTSFVFIDQFLTGAHPSDCGYLWRDGTVADKTGVEKINPRIDSLEDWLGFYATKEDAKAAIDLYRQLHKDELARCR